MPATCCCSLRTGAAIVLGFAAIESVFHLFINIQLLLLLWEKQHLDLQLFLIDATKIEDFDVFHGIVSAAIGLYAIWFVFGIIAATGNITQKHGHLTPWIFITYLITLFQFGTTIYFAVKFQNSYSSDAEFYKDDCPTKTLSYLTLLCIYSGGGVFIFLNLYFVHIVEMRGKEIDHDYFDLMMYLVSHMRRCSHLIDDVRTNSPRERPPSYTAQCPPYLPPELYNRDGSSGSSWSLSCEAMKTLSTGQPSCSLNSNNRNNSSTLNLTGRLSRTVSGYQSLNNYASDTSVLQ